MQSIELSAGQRSTPNAFYSPDEPRSAKIIDWEFSPFQGGKFWFTFKVPSNYPHEPPKVHCETKVSGRSMMIRFTHLVLELDESHEESSVAENSPRVSLSDARTGHELREVAVDMGNWAAIHKLLISSDETP